MSHLNFCAKIGKYRKITNIPMLISTRKLKYLCKMRLFEGFSNDVITLKTKKSRKVAETEINLNIFHLITERKWS